MDDNYNDIFKQNNKGKFEIIGENIDDLKLYRKELELLSEFDFGIIRKNDKATTLDELTKEFKKFEGNYIDVIEHFDMFSERDKKLFILYSLFYFELYFNKEDCLEIITQEALSEVSEHAIHLCFSVHGPIIRNVGSNSSIPLKCNSSINNIEELNLIDLVKFANIGYSGVRDEEKMFLSLNKKREKEISAFYELLSKLSKKNVK